MGVTCREEGNQEHVTVCGSCDERAIPHDLQATKDVLAMASLEVDLNKIEPGQTITVKWRGKPVFIKRRTEEDIEYARDVDLSSLRDPQTDEERTQKPEWLVLVGVCTHLGEASVVAPRQPDRSQLLSPAAVPHEGINWRILALAGLWTITR